MTAVRILGIILLLFAAPVSCGTGTISTVPIAGSAINADYTVSPLSCNGDWTGGQTASTYGLARVSIVYGAVTSCANVMSTNRPTLNVITSLPTGFSVATGEGEVNATQTSPESIYGVAYQYTLNGTSGFMTNSLDNVTITIPYRLDLVPSADRNQGKIFVRIFNHDDYSLVDVNGDVSTGGEVVLQLYGLPRQATMAVIYNANAASVISTSATGVERWRTQRFCVIYNPSKSSVISAVRAKLGLSTNPTTAQIMETVRDYVANYAVDAQEVLESDNFNDPLLFTADEPAEPCGGSGTTNRFLIYLSDKGSSFSSSDAGEVITPSANRYGRLYIAPSKINNSASSSDGTASAIIGKALFHAVANAYGLFPSLTANGYSEGMATVYSKTIDMGTIGVRSGSSSETYLFSDFLMLNKRDSETSHAYSNQDFFAYVGREYNGGGLDYLQNLLLTISSSIGALSGDANTLQPARTTLLEAMDNSFRNKLGYGLKAVYLDFLRQRLFDHNASSRFGRSGEVTSGFAGNLFETSSSDDSRNSLTQISVDASTCSLSASSGGFGNSAPYAARALQIAASTAGSGAVITVTLTPSSGNIGDTFDGYSYRAGDVSAISGTNTFSSFGTSTSDAVTLVFANVNRSNIYNITYSITCSL